jgi:steroid delta-isomerase-like uncharacterized protein
MIKQVLVLAVLFSVACDTPLQMPSGMPTGTQKSIVRGYIEEIINRGNWDVWEQYFHPHVGFNDRRLDKTGFQRMVASFRAAYPDFHVLIDDQVAEGDRVVTRLTCRGTHLGEDEGVPATGREVTYTGIAIDRIKDGKVIEMWYLSDTWARIEQIRR